MWQTPKTNWTSTDYINITDYNRWTDNLDYLKEIVTAFGGIITNWQNFSIHKTTQDIPQANDFNKIEHNLTRIYISKPFFFEIGTEKSYISNGNTPNYEELNRIESACAKINEQIEREKKELQKIPFKLGLRDIGGIF